MREDVARYVTNGPSCARNKPRRHAPYGRLQTIPVPTKPWHSVSMDLIVKLPVTARGHDSICVFVDRLTKMVHFVPCKEILSAEGFAELYIDHVFRYHGLSKEFISDRDSRFTSEFWKGVTELLGTRLCVSSSFHPQTDGQTKRVNQTLEAYLRRFVSVTLDDWDLLVSRAEFAHNNAFHESVQETPFYLNHGRHPRTHRKFSVSPPHCRKAPTALAVQDRQPVPLRSHKAAGDCRSGGACAARPRTCCGRPRAAGSPGVERQAGLPSSTVLRQVQLPVGAWGGSSPHRPALKTAEATTDRH
jgi:hypothetical protein